MGDLGKCGSSCDESFEIVKEADACRMGCSFQEPNSEKRKTEIEAPLETFFGPRVRIIRLPDFFSNFGFGDIFGNNGDDDGMGMFARMHRRMNEMANRMMQEVNTMRNRIEAGPEDMAEGSHGRMVVIRSGPGYHEKKTYRINPDGSKTEIKNDSDESSDMSK